MMRLLALLLIVSPALPAAALDRGSAELDGFFSGRAPLAASITDIAVPMPDRGLAWLDPEEIARKEREALDKYGRQPYGNQMFLLEEAMALLMNTDAGAAVCRATMPNGCGLNRFAKYGIELRVKDLKDAHAETPTYFIGTKKVITFDVDMFNGKYGSGDIAAVLAHELSHVHDVAKYQSDLPDARLATEKKAFLNGLMVYTEIYDMDREMVTDMLEMHLFMHAWRRKFEGGPNMDVTYQGRKGKLDDFLNKVMPGRVNPQEFIRAMTVFYYPEVPFTQYGPNTARISDELQVKIDAKAADYSQWRKEHHMDQASYYGPVPPPYVPPQPPVNPNPQPVTPPYVPPQQPVNPHPQPPANPNPHPQPPVNPHPQPPPPPPPPDDDPPPYNNNWDDPVDIGPDNPLYPH